MNSEPVALSQEDLHKLTWEAATERFLDVAELSKRSNPLEVALDNVLAATHNTLSGLEFFRVMAGAGSKTRDAPARITDYVPSTADVGGLFDNQDRAKQVYIRDK